MLNNNAKKKSCAVDIGTAKSVIQYFLMGP
jgi:hypothetical protein